MTGTFNLDGGATIYAGLKQWYNVAFTAAATIDNTPVTSDYPFIRLRLADGLKFTRP